jgi:chemotaxis protein CheX
LQHNEIKMDAAHTNPLAMPACEGAQEGKDRKTSLRDRVFLLTNPLSLDESVEEVFQLMVGVCCRRSWEIPVLELELVTAVVGFGGILTGACTLHCSATAARAIAAGMTGTLFAAVDDTVKDAIGEICNMVAGTWKAKTPEFAAHCDLSVPAVITGSNYQLRVQAPEFTLHHTYRFDEVSFGVTILCDGLR